MHSHVTASRGRPHVRQPRPPAWGSIGGYNILIIQKSGVYSSDGAPGKGGGPTTASICPCDPPRGCMVFSPARGPGDGDCALLTMGFAACRYGAGSWPSSGRGCAEIPPSPSGTCNTPDSTSPRRSGSRFDAFSVAVGN